MTIDHDVVIEKLREFEQVSWVSGPLEIDGLEIGPLLISQGGGLFLLECRYEGGYVECLHQGARTVLSLNRGPFPGGDPVQKMFKKFYVLQNYIKEAQGKNIRIQGVLVFPNAFVDFHFSRQLSPRKINAIRLSFVPVYLERKDKIRKECMNLGSDCQADIISILESSMI